jgi:hypothetical protein
MLNLGSLILGLSAWLLPVVNIIQHRKHNYWSWISLSLISLSACSFSLCFQIFEIYGRVLVEDWSALLDTMSTVAFVSAILLFVTVILNVITLIKYRSRMAE